ncbi:hypothetical protein ACFX15_012561 [Malus domestica]
MSRFSFVTSKPLVENYVRKRPENYSKKRPAYLTDSADTPRLLAPGDEVNPVAWVGQANGPDLQPRRLALPPLESREPLFDPFVRPTKKRAMNSSIKDLQDLSILKQYLSTEGPDQF